MVVKFSNSGNSNFIPHSANSAQSAGSVDLSSRSLLLPGWSHELSLLNEILPEEVVQSIFQKYGCHFGGRFWNANSVVHIYLAQCLFGLSCVEAVLIFVSTFLESSDGQASSIPSPNTGNYCHKRAKLHPEAIKELMIYVYRKVEEAIPESARWHGHDVYYVDGAEVILADTEANQAEYPQPKSQQPGLGFPMIRIVFIFSMVTAMVKTAAFASYSGKETGEAALLRSMLDSFKSGDVLVGDRLYCSYMMIALLHSRNIFVCTRQNVSRQQDLFSTGKINLIYKSDKIVTWKRPDRPDWMSQEEYDLIPETLTLREIVYFAERRGYRTEPVTIITSLTDTEKYSLEDMGQLYFSRWNVELDIRNLKQTLQMKMIPCKTPKMVKIDFWMRLLAYNVVRRFMYDAAVVNDPSLSNKALIRRLSFKQTRHYLQVNWDKITNPIFIGTKKHRFLTLLSKLTVPKQQRPPEPRVIKKRNNKFPKMMKPRKELKKELQEKNKKNSYKFVA